MASVEWLATHFFAKSSQRFRQFGALPIFSGERVLDMCCGPGLFVRYAADMVGPDGHVTGLDHDPVSLDFAQRYLTPFPFKNWDLVHADLESSTSRVGGYDVVLLMNCIGYLESPESAVKKIAAHAKPGTRIVVKDFDLGSVFLSPLDLEQFAKLVAAAKIANDSNNPLKFDNFLGRRVPFLHNTHDFASHHYDIWAQCLSYPFNPFEVEYIWRNIEALVLQARANCDRATLSYFENLFCRDEKPFFKTEGSLFIENEYLAVLTV